ncbi:MAG TPA: glutathione S-transferase family protein [Burkholderiaceae bacterium]
MLQLVIGNKNYSSWSMRAGVLMQHFGIPFEEIKLRLELTPDSAFHRALARYTPAGRVPVLLTDGFAVWDTLAIAEALADLRPDLPLWPRDPRQRARARSLCAEIHAGFSALRNHCPMNIEATLPDVGARVLAAEAGVRDDLARIDSMWSAQLEASGGPFLFGEFGIIDAYYAPVVARTRSYGLPLSAPARAYAQQVWASPGVCAWVSDALTEHDFIVEDEPYRRSR